MLVGDQWPYDQDIVALSQARSNREAIRARFNNFADALHSGRTTHLAEQRGHTVEDLGAAFHAGEAQARTVGTRNAIKRDAYDSAYDSMLSLQGDLTNLACEGNQRIDSVERSEQPLETKLTLIQGLIHNYRALANIAAAKYASNVLDAMQRILDTQGTGQVARQFAQAHGADIGQMFRQTQGQEDLRNDVTAMLGNGPRSHVLGSGQLPTASAPTSRGPTIDAPEHVNPHTLGDGNLPTVYRPQTGGGQVARPLPIGHEGPIRSGHTYQDPPAIPSAALPPTPVAAATRAHAAPVNPVGSPVGPIMGGHNGLAEPPLASLPHTPTITPTELAQSFNKGMESGAPFSAAARAAPPLPVTSTEPQISHAAQTIPSAAPNPQVHVPVVDSPQPVHHVTAAETPPPTPIVAAAQPISPPVTPQAVGPLPTYGSDLRPPAATTITPTPAQSAPLPPSATPSSAPVTPSSGHSAANQPAVVRQTASSTPPAPPPTQGTQAVAATATGAAIGTASADATARKRLQRLVNTVARQQPRLAWAAGDRADNTTLLVTDLASGWIPPGIDLPSAVTLLRPARRRGNVEVLLGDVTVTANYTPTHHLADDGEQTPTSSRPRSVPDVSDLGWELSQATQWRDGLPRLAHTLAKAASAGTGVLDSEIDLLHEHLAETSNRVLDNYPDHIDTHDVGNWQLLTALDALVVGDKATANYHLAWFLAAKAG